MAAAKLTAPNGATVTVDSARLDDLLRRGFTKTGDAPAKKAPAKKSAPKKSASSDDE